MEMLNAATVEVLRCQAVDKQWLTPSFSKHEANNRTNAYFLTKSEAGLAEAEQDDIGAVYLRRPLYLSEVEWPVK